MPCWLISALVHVMLIFLIAGIYWQTPKDRSARPYPRVSVIPKMADNQAAKCPKKEEIRDLGGIPEALSPDTLARLGGTLAIMILIWFATARSIRRREDPDRQEISL